MTVGGIVIWIIIGLIVGALARLVMPGPDRGGLLFTMVLGIVGAFLGGWIGSLIGAGGAPATGAAGFTWTGFLLAILGAVIVLAIYRAIAGRGGGRPVA
jgi:uncharacterized membrane protein YeaQ/YmgE (transglycosylase-associated protein family)